MVGHCNLYNSLLCGVGRHSLCLSAILTTRCFDMGCPESSRGMHEERQRCRGLSFHRPSLAFLAVAGIHWDHSRKTVKDLSEKQVVQSYGAWVAVCRFLLAFALIFSLLAVQYANDLENPLCKHNDEFNEIAYWLHSGNRHWVSVGTHRLFQFEATVVYMSSSGKGMLPEWYHRGTTQLSMPSSSPDSSCLGLPLLSLQMRAYPSHTATGLSGCAGARGQETAGRCLPSFS